MVEPILRCACGLDVHKMVLVGTVQKQNEDGTVDEQTRSFNTFKSGRRELCQWLIEMKVALVVMESTGVYWKSAYSSLERAGIRTHVVNARHIKKVPGRKTDVKDSQWLAFLARCGLVSPSFIPPEDLRELRLVDHHRVKLVDMLASEKNRLHKMLDDAGVRLGGVVSDINGVSARAIIAGLIEGQSPEQLVDYARGRLKNKREELLASLDEPLSERHRFLLRGLQAHIEALTAQIQNHEQYLFDAMSPYQTQWELLQTLPGVDKIAAVTLIVEIGIDMQCFGSANRLASWAGMCPGNDESAGKRKNTRTSKGNRMLRRILCEVANAARKTESQFKGKYQGLVIRRGHKRTIIALGHKLLRVIYSMLNNNRPYIDPQVNYEELMVRRNAPRWISALVRFGHLKVVTDAAKA